MMKKWFGILTVLLVLVIIFCIKGTVMSMENPERVKQNHCYAAWEEEYLESARDLLNREGYTDCGINLTWVAYEDGSREYTVLIHHRKLERLSEEQKGGLRTLLSRGEFQDKTCSFRYDF